MECWDCYQQKTWKTWEQGLSGVIKFPILKGSNNAMVWYFEWFPLEWCIVWVEDIMTPAVTLLFWTFHRLAGFQKWWLINPFLQVMFLHEVPVIEKRKTDQTTTKTVAMDRMDFAGVGCGASNFQKSFEVLLMEEILHQLIGTGSLSHYLQGFYISGCRISSINSISKCVSKFWGGHQIHQFPRINPSPVWGWTWELLWWFWVPVDWTTSSLHEGPTSYKWGEKNPTESRVINVFK